MATPEDVLAGVEAALMETFGWEYGVEAGEQRRFVAALKRHGWTLSKSEPDREQADPTWAHTPQNDPAGLYDDSWEYAAAPPPEPPGEPAHYWVGDHGVANGGNVLPPEPALREFAEDVARQFGYWTAGDIGGLTAGGLSTLEEAFAILGWDDPHPLPDRRCDEPNCMNDATMGWPTRPGGTGPNGGYRRTCWDHSDIGRARAALASDPVPPE